jgi:hypothetical protein
MQSVRANVDHDTVNTYLKGTIMTGAKLHLFTNNPVLNPLMVVGDFTEATFAGSVALTLIYGATYNDADGFTSFSTVELTFMTDGVIPETVNGWYVTDSTGAVVLFADYFTTPQQYGAAGDGYSFSVVFGLKVAPEGANPNAKEY